MAKFEIAEAITGRNEGLYANNQSDTGGETFAGISRNNWPKWEGWKTIDFIKIHHGKTATIINKQAKYYPALTVAISDFYKKNFWDVLKLDLVNDQQLANSVYDFGVNSGTGRSAKFLQQAVNNVCGVGLSVDGQIGNKTITEVNKHDGKSIYIVFNKLREEFYRSIAKGSQSQFLKSWLSRLKIYQ